MESTHIELDVRPVEPRHRYDTIMNAYEALQVGGAMALTVDHDPQCMYYTLRATQGDDSFGFDYLEKGPETWRVVVTKNSAGVTADTCQVPVGP